jgi:hypothetical protein
MSGKKKLSEAEIKEQIAPLLEKLSILLIDIENEKIAHNLEIEELNKKYCEKTKLMQGQILNAQTDIWQVRRQCPNYENHFPLNCLKPFRGCIICGLKP